uniref:Secreted protein n=1 Tax=Romanomermis culicivorax TaxID=13658 RepID=A0A915J024_ROMCU
MQEGQIHAKAQSTMLAITVLIIHLAFVGEIIAQFCETPQVVQKYFGKLIDHDKQLGSCGNEQHGRPEAALLQLCRKSVGKINIIMVLNQWCGKIDSFGCLFLPIETAKKYYKIRAG